MKLVVIVPAYNEEKTIGELILGIPRKISGFDKIEVLVIDDGSRDKTVDFAMNAGADKIVSHSVNRGMGETFMTGIRNCISMKADVAVIIDADLQFDPKDIPKLTIPIINNQLDVVLGSRWLNQKVQGIPKRKLVGNKLFTKVIDQSPDFAEAWNKRATVYFLKGELDKSIADIEKTLELEPRHFGALDGLAEIYLIKDDLLNAAATYRRILEIIPISKKSKDRIKFISESMV